MDYRAQALLDGRREALERALGRTLTVPNPSEGPDLSEAEREHLLSDATDLYQNELAWEDITDEEQVEGEPLSELTFPGFLAYIRGLLLEQVMPDSLAPANPRPEVVEEIVGFLADNVVALQDQNGSPEDEDASRTERDLALTDRLLDLVLFQIHGVDPADVEGFRDSASAS
jgi:hypothetical protein